MRHQLPIAFLLVTLAWTSDLQAERPIIERPGFNVDILVDGAPRPEFSHRGTTYVEALRGRNYAIRITNPTPNRVAVALAVDGLNTIDAKRTSPGQARKWVVDPYGSVVISGWQVNDSTAREFTFTGERDSYGAFLGQTQNLGVIEAAFFRERRREITTYSPRREQEGYPMPASPSERKSDAAPRGAGAASESQPKGQASGTLADEYAATGMGDRTRHEVSRVDMELESSFTTIRIRYEFRPQLVKLGVIREESEPLTRREHSRGFSGYCPEPGY